ncbi:MAG: hypothetical protein M1834_006647 [Cirrosporium novae-zelandiae]|nr:MAG: hypothetical protein M1834_006647 [Cirrosporium novae-zelandiae]
MTAPNPSSNLPLPPFAYYGIIIHAPTPTKLVIQPHTLLVVTPPKITLIVPSLPAPYITQTLVSAGFNPNKITIHTLPSTSFLIPGFIDTHNHAPQWTQRGVGRGRLLMDWLNTITFPHESRFSDTEYAKKTYASLVDGFLNQGVTTASYYGSIHTEATKILAEVCLEKGQRALVGKCNMDQNAPDFYCETSAEASLVATHDFLAQIQALDPTESLVSPILTPRFAITCSAPLLAGLGDLISKNPTLRSQTHFNEAEQEMYLTKTLFPEFPDETALYTHFSLLNSRSILAHCIFLTPSDFSALKSADAGVSHCPISNTTIGPFMCAPVREFLRHDIKVGLGTDSGGGYSASILDAMKLAFVVSKARELETAGKDEELTLTEGFYLATRGGARVCGLEEKVGVLEVGMEFDALEIRTGGIMAPVEEETDDLGIIFEKFLMSGDDRNIRKVFVAGRCVKGGTSEVSE